ncbi:MAG: sulfate adenylyltransferase, partial [Promethearchaeota archaeon]
MSSSENLIPPHGGKLINRLVDKETGIKLMEKATNYLKLPLDARGLADLECIATGIYSPLTGFLDEKDYHRVVKEMRLSNGTVWPIPVTLGVNKAFSNNLEENTEFALTWKNEILAIMTISSIYHPDKKEETKKVYGTDDPAHPGVAAVFDSGETYLGGSIQLIKPVPHNDFQQYRLTPAQTRAEFSRRGWRTVVAFQTRNPIHRAHEYLQKVALESVDGLFINPLVGETKKGDIPADVRMKTYEAVLNNYYPKNRFVLGVFPANMRYAGPNEAIMHSIARTNYGCSHFIVGRDHAGVGKYYGTYDAQKIFDQFSSDELAITPMKFE